MQNRLGMFYPPTSMVPHWKMVHQVVLKGQVAVHSSTVQHSMQGLCSMAPAAAAAAKERDSSTVQHSMQGLRSMAPAAAAAANMEGLRAMAPAAAKERDASIAHCSMVSAERILPMISCPAMETQ